MSKPEVSGAATRKAAPGLVRPVHWFHHLCVALTSVLFWPWGVRALGRENVPLTGPLIIAGSHSKNIDPVVLAQAMPRARYIQYMAKKELFKNSLVAGLFRTLGTFPVDREGNDVGAIRTSLRILQAGGTLGIFPQGTRGGQSLHPGTALIALKSKTPVVPTSITQRGRRWTVRFGTSIAPEGGVDELTAKIGAAIEALRAQG